MRQAALPLSLLLLVTTSGCLLTSDLDRFKDEDGQGTDSTDCDNPRNVCFRFTGFEDRADEIVRADLITGGFLRARGIYEPIEQDGDVETILPLAILDSDIDADADFEVQITTDQDANGEIVPEVDHTFSVALPASGNLIVTESDDAPFDVPQELSGDFNMAFEGMTAHEGQLIEVWVQEAASGRTAGYYRMAQGPDGGDFSIAIAGIIGEVGSEYRVQFYADFNGSGAYEVRGGNPQGDHSWVREVTADDDGLSLTFVHTGIFEDLDIAEGYGF